jgi:hypothetical protein
MAAHVADEIDEDAPLGNVVPPAFDGVLRRPHPPVRRML